MSKIRSIFAIALILGLVIAEFWPSTGELKTPSPVPQAEAKYDDLISSILDSYIDIEYQIPDRSKISTFVDFDLPRPSSIDQDTFTVSQLSGYTSSVLSDDPTLPDTSYSSSSPPPSSILNKVVPPFGSPLYTAYQDGAKAWYQKDDNVLVIYPNENIGSFNASTGMPSTWLKQELAYEPIDDANAISNYIKNYRAEVVAETTRWVLMEFPSGGVVKVIKPSFASSNQETTGVSVGSPAYGNLPSVLPGYGN
ncbi:hypothetical protein DRH29_00810 [candidate division Kazan bacterium]|uniref:Uncharacterized protein n=1 Tax=candidate division Kazan bacterium TaxID=2202143 RepID=A0A420ZDJ0_UNCK3|nr:MAG: hypothetical protein DRH29_00810 [candidate division Kazan bacterium]